MKVALSIAVALVILSSIPVKLVLGQDAVQAQTTAGAAVNAQAGQSSAHANASASADANLRPIQGELVNKLDSKSAKVGDEVVLKTKDKVETADGTVIPKGSRLVGHVTDVQTHGNGHADSRLSFAFDRAELKGGQNVAIHSVIRAVAPPASIDSSMVGDDSLGAGPSAGSMAGGGHSMGGGRGGAGIVGGAAGSATAVTGNAISGAGTASASALHTTGDVAGEADAGIGNGLRGSTGAAGSVAAHSTAIPGVMLQSDASAATSGTLSASKHNLHLDAGTEFTLGVAAAATTMR